MENLEERDPQVSIHGADDEYQVQQFRGSDRIISRLLPELMLTAKQVFAAAEV